MRYEFGGLIFGGAYFRNFTVFDDISLVLYVRRLCVIVPRKCVIVWSPHGVDMWSRCWAVSAPKYFVPAINIVSSVFSLADFALKKQFSTQENWIYL